VSVRIADGGTGDSITIRGAPILYALSIPEGAPDPQAARAFVQWLFGPDGRKILTDNGFTVLDLPIVHGTAPSWLHSTPR
jgi:molybdate/tungstate transport system substrate-binding protein